MTMNDRSARTAAVGTVLAVSVALGIPGAAINLSSAANGTIVDGRGVGYIRDDDRI